MVYIKTCKNIADIMTKQSAGPQFAQHRDSTLGRIDVIAAVIAAVAEIRRKIRIRDGEVKPAALNRYDFKLLNQRRFGLSECRRDMADIRRDWRN